MFTLIRFFAGVITGFLISKMDSAYNPVHIDPFATGFVPRINACFF
jgi:hypothetical protein